MLARFGSYLNVEEIVDRIRSDQALDGETIGEFERKFARYTGTLRCFATNQARAGLLIALKSLPITHGDEVIVQSFTFKGVVDAILDAGGEPVLVDNSPDDLNADVDAIERSMTEKTKAVIATHLFGVPCEIDAISSLARENGCYVIEDCAQCLGAAFGGRSVGTFGDMAIFSFNYEKHMTTGQGGILAVNNSDLIGAVNKTVDTYKRAPLDSEKCFVYGMLLEHLALQRGTYKKRLTATFGEECYRRDRKLFREMDGLVEKAATEEEIRAALLPYLEKHVARLRSKFRQGILPERASRRLLGVRDRFRTPPREHVESEHLLMNAYRAAVGCIALDHLDAVNSVRNENAERYLAELDGQDAYGMLAISSKKRPAFLKLNVLNNTSYPVSEIAALAEKSGFELGNFQWPNPVHLTYPYNALVPHRREDLQTSEHIADHLINVPVHCYVTPEDITGIVEFLARIGSKRGR